MMMAVFVVVTRNDIDIAANALPRYHRHPCSDALPSSPFLSLLCSPLPTTLMTVKTEKQDVVTKKRRKRKRRKRNKSQNKHV